MLCDFFNDCFIRKCDGDLFLFFSKVFISSSCNPLDLSSQLMQIEHVSSILSSWISDLKIKFCSLWITSLVILLGVMMPILLFVLNNWHVA